MRGFELSEKYFVAEMEFESFELTGGETAVGREVPAKEHRLGVAIKVGQNFKYDKPCFASAVRSSCAGFCAVKFTIGRTQLK